ncbi:MAG: hypothetical protein Q7K33_01770 [Candidatus Berkelbacteria bacterium]|nr:hypothetical protein [Candidatus Berkelbacteria bacterium]
MKKLLKNIELVAKKAQVSLAEPQRKVLNSDYPDPEKTLKRVSAIIKNFSKENSARKLRSLIGYLSSQRSQEV